MTMSDDLSDRLTAAEVNAKNHAENASDLRERAETIGTQHQRSLPTHSGNWSKQAVENYLSDLQRAVTEPQVSQSKMLLQEAGFTEKQTDNLSDEILQNYNEIQTLKQNYEALEDTFGASRVEFLVDDELLLEWLRQQGAAATAQKIDIADDAPYSTLDNLDALPEELITQYFKGVLRDNEHVTDAQDLESKVLTLTEAGVEFEYSGDRERFESQVNEAEGYYTELKDDFGFDSDTVNGWIQGNELQDALDTLEDKHDDAARRRQRLRSEIREYCQLLGEDEPSTKSVPELKSKRDDLKAQLEEQLGTTGTTLLQYIRGETDELPSSTDADELRKGMRKIRPFLQEHLSGGE